MNPTKPIVLILKNFNNLTIKNVNIEEPKKKGRPKKTIITSEDNVQPIEPKKRGRPKKNTTPQISNREDLKEPKEPKKRGRPKKNITITNDTSSESSADNHEPKKRGRPKKIETTEMKEESEEEYSSSSESEPEENDEEVEGFYIKLDKNAITGYTFVSSISESDYIIRPNLKLYNPHTFMYCGTWDTIRVRAPALKPTNE
jgi:hypothetical protein